MHRQCKIDHQRYNFINFSPKFKPPSLPQNDNETKIMTLSSQHRRQENMFIINMCKKIDRFQSSFGVPPPPCERDYAADLLNFEFAEIWKNVLCFQHNVLDFKHVQTNSNYSIFKPPKRKYTRTAIVLESKPLKVRNKNVKNKSKNLTIPKYEPMDDAQLAKALNLDECELSEAFGYAEQELNKMFNDDDYEVDTNGLQLIDDDELAAMFGYPAQNSSFNDEDLAAAQRYVEGNRSSSSSTLDENELAAEFGYGVSDEANEQHDDTFGYSADEESTGSGYDTEVDSEDGQRSTSSDETDTDGGGSSTSSGDGSESSSSEDPSCSSSELHSGEDTSSSS